jgi:hypothetical protein
VSATPAPEGYAHAQGITPAEFLKRFGVPMPPRDFGEESDRGAGRIRNMPKASAFGLKGETGITILEGAAA